MKASEKKIRIIKLGDRWKQGALLKSKKRFLPVNEWPVFLCQIVTLAPSPPATWLGCKLKSTILAISNSVSSTELLTFIQTNALWTPPACSKLETVILSSLNHNNSSFSIFPNQLRKKIRFNLDLSSNLNSVANPWTNPTNIMIYFFFLDLRSITILQFCLTFQHGVLASSGCCNKIP